MAERPAEAVPAGLDPAGLDPGEAREILARDGLNEPPRARPPSLPGRAARHVADPMSLLLLAAGLTTLVVLGEVPEGVAILAILMVNVVVGTAQELRADHALEALRAMTAPTAKVWRGGVLTRVPAAEVVTGDLADLAAGDRVPADGRVRRAEGLAVDESALTGEALAADKSAAGAFGAEVPLGDRTGEVFAGSLVVRGAGLVHITATGANTQVGRIATALRTRPPAPLERELRQVSTRIGLLAVGVGVVVVLIGLDRVLSGQAWILDIVLVGVALAIAAVPESLATAVTTALALGAQRMARSGVIVRRPAAIEALGATTVIASDKTGTLTTGRLTVAGVTAVGGREDDLWAAALACNDARDEIGDPVDVALRSAALAEGAAEPEGPRLATRPFDAETRSMTVVRQAGDGLRLTVKGAPEAVLPRCRPGPDTDALGAAVAGMTAAGLRVLAFADGDTGDLDATGLRPLGLAGLSDELRDSARDAVAECRAAGIRVVMVTGDHADTARVVAEDAGIVPDPVVTGSELATGAAERHALLRSAGVVARVDPRTKLDLVHAYRESGDVITMTGDGVNDAPALRHADVGVAIAGDEGTDVAREAAAVVVTTGDLGTIVTGVRHGRRLYHNVGSMVGYLVTGNLSEIVIVVAGLLLWPELVLPLLPVHLLWVNLVMDGIPALALGVDRAPGDPLTNPPRRPGDTLLGRHRLVTMTARALATAALVLGAAQAALSLGWTDEQVRTQVVLTLVLVRLAIALVVRARRWTFERGWWRSPAVLGAIAVTATVEALVVLVPPFGAPLAQVPVPLTGWAMALGAAALTPPICDALRRLGGRALGPG